MKPSAYLVNTARGECVDEAALLMALDESVASGGRHGIRAVALDTLAHEARERNERLIRHPRCVVTPHSAYDFTRGRRRAVPDGPPGRLRAAA